MAQKKVMAKKKAVKSKSKAKPKRNILSSVGHYVAIIYRYLFLVWYLLMLLLVIAAGYVVYVGYHNVAMELNSQPLKTIELTSNNKYVDQKLLTKIILKSKLKSYFQQDIQELATYLTQELSCARTIKINKQWPDKLNIAIVEYEPVARWNKNQYVAFDGKVFSLPKSIAKLTNLPKLSATDDESVKVLREYLRLKELFAKHKLELVALELNKIQQWTAVIAPEIYLQLGADNLANKVEQFATIYYNNRINQNKTIKYADFRYKSGVAIKHKYLNTNN